VAGRLLWRPLLQAQAGPLRGDVVEQGNDVGRPTRNHGAGARRDLRTPALVSAILVAASGWGWAAYEHFVRVPIAENNARVAYALDLVDRFDDTPAHKAYIDLATEMKPWWEAIEDIQRRIQNAPDDDTRDALISERDASLITFVESHDLAPKVDLLIGSFDLFTRCLVASVCDEAAIERAISIDVKRIWRTFRPWVLHRRTTPPGDRSYGRDIEDLYFRFVG